jgi:hypothetical protein
MSSEGRVSGSRKEKEEKRARHEKYEQAFSVWT